MEPKHEFTCQKCKRTHARYGSVVSEAITCSCGNEFFAFESCGMTIVLPIAEIRDERVGRQMQKLIAITGRGYEEAIQQDSKQYLTVLREADPERLLSVALNRVQGEIFGINILQSKNILAMCEFLSRGKDLAVRYKKDKNRIVLNELDPKDLMAEWEKNHEGDIRRAGDSHYEPGEWAEWQEATADDMAYFRALEENHRKTG